jgi:hypothetical protein
MTTAFTGAGPGRMFLNSAEVAQLLELPSANSFLARRDDLEQLGFPPPCPWSARPLKWRADLVHSWIEAVTRQRALGQRPQLVVSNSWYMDRAATA